MAYTDHLETVQEFYVAYYGRPADPEGLIFWAEQLDENNGDVTQIINSFATSVESTSRYTGQTAEEQIATIYDQILGRAPDAEGLTFYAEKIAADEFTLGDLMIRVADGVQGDDILTLQNRVAVAVSFTNQVDTAGTEYIGTAAAAMAIELLDQIGAATDTAAFITNTVPNVVDIVAAATASPEVFNAMIPADGDMGDLFGAMPTGTTFDSFISFVNDLGATATTAAEITALFPTDGTSLIDFMEALPEDTTTDDLLTTLETGELDDLNDLVVVEVTPTPSPGGGYTPPATTFSVTESSAGSKVWTLSTGNGNVVVTSGGGNYTFTPATGTAQTVSMIGLTEVVVSTITLSGFASDLALITTITGDVTVSSSPDVAQLKAINAATTGAITLGETSGALSGTAADLVLAFAGTVTEHTGTVEVTGALVNADLADLNTISGETTGVVTAAITDTATNLDTLTTAVTDAITMHVSAGSVAATVLTSLAGKTSVAVDATLITTITGTAAEIASVQAAAGITKPAGWIAQPTAGSAAATDLTAIDLDNSTVVDATLITTITGTVDEVLEVVAAAGSSITVAANVNYEANSGLADNTKATALLAATNTGTTVIAEASVTGDQAEAFTYNGSGNDTITALTVTGAVTGANAVAIQTDITNSDVGSVVFATGDGGVTVDLTGLTAATTVTGGTGADNITGGAGNNIIRGGADADTMTGGDGGDTFVVLGAIGADDYVEADVTGTAAQALGLATLIDTGLVTSDSGADGTGETYAGGAGTNTIEIWGAANLTSATLSNIDTINTHSDLTISATQLNSLFATNGAVALNLLDGTSKITINDADAAMGLSLLNSFTTGIIPTDFDLSSDAPTIQIDLVTISNTATTYTIKAEDMFDLSGGTNTLTDASSENSVMTADGTTVTTVNAEDGDDIVVIGAMGSTVTVDGGEGDDILAFADTNANTNDLDLVTNVEIISLIDNGAGASITTVDSLVDHTVQINGLSVVASDLTTVGLTFDGSAETLGYFRIQGSDIGDTITGGDGADYITGGAGADTLIGNAGADTFVLGTTLVSGVAGDAVVDGGVDASVGVAAGTTNDTITFLVIDDTIAISETVFGTMGNGATGVGAVLNAAQFHSQAGTGAITNVAFDVVGNGAFIYDSTGDDLYFVEAGATYTSGTTALTDMLTAETALKVADITITGVFAATDIFIVA